MDFNKIIINSIASIIFVLKRFFLLIFFPYKTLRKISQEDDYSQLAVIFFFVFAYFSIAGGLRKFNLSVIIVFLFFFTHFLLTTLFFYWLSTLFNKNSSYKSFVFTFAYSLLPTLFWFITNSILFIIIPPPRSFSLLGKSFSVMFISFSLSLLIWKIILNYLAIRFSSRLSFYKIIYFIILYLCFFIPCSILLYSLKIFRIPFI